MDRWFLLFATGFHISYIPIKLLGLRKWSGAGLLGTVEGAALLPLLPESPRAFGAALAAAIALACWVCGRAERALGTHDDPRIVLDEVVGFWAAAAFLPRTPAALAACFLLFRALDSLKVPPISWLDRLPGGTGIVADDLGAALAANLAVRGIMAAWPGLLA